MFGGERCEDLGGEDGFDLNPPTRFSEVMGGDEYVAAIVPLARKDAASAEARVKLANKLR